MSDGKVKPTIEALRRKKKIVKKQLDSRARELEKVNESLRQEITRLERREADLGARVQERTANLIKLEEAFQLEVAERQRAESGLRTLKDQFADDLAGISRLHEISSRLVPQGELQHLLNEMLDAAVSITRADMGTLQLLDPASNALKIVAQRGFGQEFCEFFENVHVGDAACGTAMQHGERVIVEEVTQSSVFVGTPALDVLLAAGARAVQSTPLVSRSGKLIGMFSTHYRSPHRPGENELRLLDLLVRQAADFIERAQAEEAVRRSREELRTLAARLQQAGENERAQLAREIHDELSGTLTALKMDLFLLPDRAGKDRGLFLEKQRSMSELIDRTLSRVQSIVAELRPVVLDKFGLIAAVEWQAREFQGRSGIACEMHLPAEEISLDSEGSTGVFRILQEALVNVVRHANASEVAVDLRREGECLVLQVRDNGKGIEKTKISDDNSVGLIGMRERALSLGGTVEISRPLDGGTLVELRVPIR